ncbi:ligand-binding protein SH3 [Bacillus canaveralius]|uniref:Ligand-binding protein SH3 n=1 Tax=Bacillus canaveralius TaxID=1403243 RepID=A0A2N5GS01_9BACI|nr:multidrug efflux SMR transporter [Bacillus canaveralius]PLR86306.1 ligand-binding protein SH3 [Bacillus canaveralius]PLR98539.1 ligand-binding protein SH3 [Bacillus canaveralius]
MAWFYLLLAGLSEIGWAFGLKYSKGFSEPVPTVVTIMLIIVSFMLFAKAMKTIPIGTAYAVFTGIGAAGTALIGIVFLGEPAGLLKVLFISLLLGGIIGLKRSSTDQDERTEGAS